MKREEHSDGSVWFDCTRCGAMFQGIEATQTDYFRELQESVMKTDGARVCKDCAEKIDREREESERKEARFAFLAKLPKLIENAGIPDGYRFDRGNGEELKKPVVPHVARWIWEHRESNLVVTGATGMGKSTSGCFCAVRMIAQGKRVRYCKLRKLLSEWRDARTCDDRYADEKFFLNIQKLDLFVLDEVIGKTKNTESGQEMMYELLDMVCDGEIKTRVWLLGNFRPGSIVDLFGDDEPVRRRLQENFLCVEAKRQCMEQFDVWNKTGE